MENTAGLIFPVSPSLQTFGGKVVEVFDVSGTFVEAPAISNPGLLTVQADQMFHPGTVFLVCRVLNRFN